MYQYSFQMDYADANCSPILETIFQYQNKLPSTSLAQSLLIGRKYNKIILKLFKLFKFIISNLQHLSWLHNKLLPLYCLPCMCIHQYLELKHSQFRNSCSRLFRKCTLFDYRLNRLSFLFAFHLETKKSPEKEFLFI